MRNNQFYSFHPLAQTFGTLVEDLLGKGLNDIAGGQIFQMHNPSINVLENDSEFTLEVAAPGLQKSDFNVYVEKNQLIIAADIKEDANATSPHYTKREFSFKSFKRSFTLPDTADQNKIQAQYENGILHVKVAKNVDAPQVMRNIEIK